MRKSSRNLNWDLFRGVAICLVLIRHMRPCPTRLSQWGHQASEFLQRGAWVGVDLFFVLSGFLIGGLLFKEFERTGGIQVGRFFLRRAFKILPLLWVAVAALSCFALWRGVAVKFDWAAPDLFFYSDYTGGLLGVTWSLSVEEHFYLLLPLGLLLLLALRRPSEAAFHRLPAVMAGTAAACLGLRALSFGGTEHFDFYAQFTCSHLRIDALLAGVVLAYCFCFFREQTLRIVQQHRIFLLLLGLTGLAPDFFLPNSNFYIIVFGLGVNWLAAGALLAVVLTWSPQATLPARWLAFVGRQSYAIYLFHSAIGSLALPFVYGLYGRPPPWAVDLGLYLGLSLLVGAALTQWIEIPLLELRDRLFPSPCNSSSPARDAAPPRAQVEALPALSPEF